MTADPIQQAASVLRDHAWRDLGMHRPYNTRTFGCWACDWEGDSSSIATHQAQALADAGLLPTETEWGIKDGGFIWNVTATEAAETRKDIATRNVTPWKDADA